MIGLKLVWSINDPSTINNLIALAVEKATDGREATMGRPARIGVGIFAGEELSIQHLVAIKGELGPTGERMIFGKAEVVRSRKMSSLEAREWLERNRFVADREQFAPDGVWLGGAVPVTINGRDVAMVSVTGGDHKDFDHPVGVQIAKDLEEFIRAEMHGTDLLQIVDQITRRPPSPEDTHD